MATGQDTSTNMTEFATRHPLKFDKAKMIRRLFMLANQWELRNKDFPFYTLGRSAYLDGITPAYSKDQTKTNELLYKNFSELYKVILETLSKELQEEVFLAKDLCWPGFHIFISDKKFLTIAGNWHNDYPHTTLGLEDIDTSTFTVPLMIPKSGAGIDYLKDEIVADRVQHFPYVEKEMIWHNGKTIHRIAGFKEHVFGEFRITMQGHLVRRDNKMEVFW